jgi:uncharacterized protein YoxC
MHFLHPLAFQISTDDPLFPVMIVIALSFLIIAVAMVVIALFIARALGTLRQLEERAAPLIERVNALGEQVTLIAQQGRETATQVNEISGHLATASRHFSESAALIKDEVRELRQLVGQTAEAARDKVQLASQAIDSTHAQIRQTTTFVQTRVVEPAREIAAIMAGIRRGLEVFVAPPKKLGGAYSDDEMFIG